MDRAEIESAAIHHLLSHCGTLRKEETCLIVADATTRALMSSFTKAVQRLGAKPLVAEIAVADRHGKEPPIEIASLMSEANLVIGLTKMSMAHTRARQNLCARGGRYLSMPGYSHELLADPCIRADYRGQFGLVKAVTDAFSAGSSVRVKTSLGTDIKLVIAERIGNCCPGFVTADYPLGSPPDIESNVSPVENLSEGIAVIDGSVACEEIGLLETPITLRISEGRIVDVNSKRSDYVEKVNRLFSRIGNPKASILAECGIGLNPLAELTGNMLTDEGALGCVHFGFGSNITVGGTNDVPFHTDFVMRDASLWIDDVMILDQGTPVLSPTGNPQRGN